MVYTIISSYSKLPTGWMACLPFTAAQVNWWPPHQMENSRFECYIFIWLVVDLLLWKIWKSVGIIVPNIWKNKKCSEPPTSYIWHCFTLFSLFLSLSYYSHFDDMIISFFFLNPVFNPHLLPLHRQWFFCLHRHDLTGGLAASSKNTTYGVTPIRDGFVHEN